MPLVVLKRQSAVDTMFPASMQRCWVLAFHNVYGRAMTLPEFEPTTITLVNQVRHELEHHGVWTGEMR